MGLEESLILDFLLLLAEGVRVKLELLEGVVVDEVGDVEDLRGKLVRVAVRFGEAVTLVVDVATGAGEDRGEQVPQENQEENSRAEPQAGILHSRRMSLSNLTSIRCL